MGNKVAQHETIPALTILQPWASAMLPGPNGEPPPKQIETRSWQTSYRGPMAIHAGASTRHCLPCSNCGMERWIDYKAGLRAAEAAGFEHRWEERIAFGAIIAVAELVDCGVISAGTGVVPALVGCQLCIYGVSPRERALGDYTPGRYGWVLRDVTPITPIPWRGKQGLWRLPTSVVEARGD